VQRELGLAGGLLQQLGAEQAAQALGFFYRGVALGVRQSVPLAGVVRFSLGLGCLSTGFIAFTAQPAESLLQLFGVTTSQLSVIRERGLRQRLIALGLELPQLDFVVIQQQR